MKQRQLTHDQVTQLQLLLITYLKKDMLPPPECDLLTQEEKTEVIQAYLNYKEGKL